MAKGTVNLPGVSPSSKTVPAFQMLTASTYTLQILANNKYLSSDII
jgi:hypothetical protein